MKVDFPTPQAYVGYIPQNLAGFDPELHEPIYDSTGRMISFKEKRTKTNETNLLEKENKGDYVQFTASKETQTEEASKVEKSSKNVQKEYDKFTKEINFEEVSKSDQDAITDVEQEMKKIEDPTVSSFRAVLISQNLLKSLDDLQQNVLNSIKIEDEIKKETEEKETTVIGVNKDFGYLTSAYKTFGTIDYDTRAEEHNMDLVG